ncbi:hypothetical protein R75461_07883 [Paraburkholderia nemoris]|uniref:M23 family metallopeptidase n=1 Tax=Paraburkholderia nemoris TaxID=2793076 RepID=UPI00190BE13B|nr:MULTISPECIES: M23 family metallopeptidase [Paraburkholderia]MBK3786915.1 M23 family metallopeptidase [Paraburkholderia aspalathi]CAE6859014.1 hypothetical protein R75461_07883 [Paraburkholderia nemoris]
MLSVSSSNSPERGEPLVVLTRRAALGNILAAAGVSSALALVAGDVIGSRLPAHDVAGAPSDTPAGRDDAMAELDRLNVSVAQIEARLARLAAQVSGLHAFGARLAAPEVTPAPALPPTHACGEGCDGEGGPALPPKSCARTQTGQVGAAAVPDVLTMQQQVDCIAVTLSVLEQAMMDHEVALAAYPGRVPVDGARFGSPFGNRIDPFTHQLSFHPGVDLVAPSGTPILATAGGRVIFAGPKGGYGNAVEIDHGNGFVTLYGHASRVLVHEGGLVLPGEHIADVGSTGRSTGAHLHFEVRVNDTPLDPAGYLALFAAHPAAGPAAHPHG